MNNAGLVAGNASTFPAHNAPPPIHEGFVYNSKTGAINTFSVAGATFMNTNGINNAGLVSGTAGTNSYSEEGFVYNSKTGATNTFSVTGATYIYVIGINNAGLVYGTTGADSLFNEGFVYNSKTGATNTFSVAGAYMAPAGINDAGLVYGTADTKSGSESFLYDYNTGVLSMLGSPGQTQLYANAINGDGTLVGSITNVSPVPLPAALPLFGAALMTLGGLFGWRRHKWIQASPSTSFFSIISEGCRALLAIEVKAFPG